MVWELFDDISGCGGGGVEGLGADVCELLSFISGGGGVEGRAEGIRGLESLFPQCAAQKTSLFTLLPHSLPLFGPFFKI